MNDVKRREREQKNRIATGLSLIAMHCSGWRNNCTAKRNEGTSSACNRGYAPHREDYIQNVGCERSGGAHRLRAQRGDCNLSDHAGIADGRMGGCVVGSWREEFMEHGSVRDRDAERRGALPE